MRFWPRSTLTTGTVSLDAGRAIAAIEAANWSAIIGSVVAPSTVLGLIWWLWKRHDAHVDEKIARVDARLAETDKRLDEHIAEDVLAHERIASLETAKDALVQRDNDLGSRLQSIDGKLDRLVNRLIENG